MDEYSSDSENNEILRQIFSIRRKRKFKNRPKYRETLDDIEFLRRFRVSKITFAELLGKIKHRLEPQTER
jgi:hypothetical protein